MVERGIAIGRIIGTRLVGEERLVSTAGVAAASGVAEKGKRSSGRAGHSRGVAEKRPNASGGIVVSGVGKEGPGTDRCIKASRSVAPQREETNCSIETTSRTV